MKSERLIVLVSPEEKARIAALAARQQKSVGELVRLALRRLEAEGLDRPQADSVLPPEQEAALERLAALALGSMQRANRALDQAFEELEATRVHFAKRHAGTGAQPRDSAA